ncbi:MAG: MoaD/ThiS family protein [Deltaproteobacteria bacterium]|nr:MoaD/ThiS family protein [Deltaproteobacteria bacterium]
MSSVRVHFHGPIDRRGHPQDHDVAIEPGATIDQLLTTLGYPETQRKVIMATVAGEQRKRSYVISDGDVVEIFVVASGG